jgi:hypothetical protein
MKLSSWVSISNTDKHRISSKAVFALVFYLLLPTVAIMMIILTYPELNSQRLLAILIRIIPISLGLILISQFQVRYERGSLGRFILNEVYVLLVVVWIFALLGGEPVIHQTWEEYSFSLHIWNYLALILFITGINVLYYGLEYKAFGENDAADEIAKDAEPLEAEPVAQKGVIITTIPSD